MGRRHPHRIVGFTEESTETLIAPLVGLIANPNSSKDIRRLVGVARVVDAEEKANIAARFLVGLTAGPATRVLAFDDPAGLVRRAIHLVEGMIPPVALVDTPKDGTEADTRRAAAAIAAAGAAGLATIGGDGTVRAAVEGWPDARLVPLAAGTNNAIGLTEEPTILGMATALAVRRGGFRPVDRLSVAAGERAASALVDVVGVRTPWMGARAIWEPDDLVEAFVVNATRTAPGIAAVAAALGPIPPGRGRHLRFGPGVTIRAPLAPGLVRDVTVSEVTDLDPGIEIPVDPRTRLLALDGERRVVGHGATVTVTAGRSNLDLSAVLGRERE